MHNIFLCQKLLLYIKRLVPKAKKLAYPITFDLDFYKMLRVNVKILTIRFFYLLYNLVN